MKTYEHKYNAVYVSYASLIKGNLSKCRLQNRKYFIYVDLDIQLYHL